MCPAFVRFPFSAHTLLSGQSNEKHSLESRCYWPLSLKCVILWYIGFIMVACIHSSSSPAEFLSVSAAGSPLSALYVSSLSSIESPTCGNMLSESGCLLSNDCTLSHWNEDGCELTRLAQGSSSIDEWSQLWLRSMPLPPPPPRPPPPPPRPRKPPADAGVPGVLGWLPRK